MNTIYSVLDSCAYFNGLSIHNHVLALIIVLTSLIVSSVTGYIFAALLNGEIIAISKKTQYIYGCLFYIAIFASYHVESWPRFLLMSLVWTVVCIIVGGVAGYYTTRSLYNKLTKEVSALVGEAHA